jgi:hypothetical protein
MDVFQTLESCGPGGQRGAFTVIFVEDAQDTWNRYKIRGKRNLECSEE